MEISKNWLKLKIFMTKVLTKLGFAAKYDYGDYKRRRNIFLALLIIFSIIIGVVISILAENFKTAQLEKENSQLQNQLQNNAASKEIEVSRLNSLLAAKDAKLEEKSNELNEKENKLAGKDKELSKKENQLNLTEQNLGLCKEETISLKEQNAKSKDEISQLEISLDACSADKKTLVNTLVNFVKAVCCSFDDTSKGRELKWSLRDGKIVCDGEFKINCATGVTDYQK